MFSVLTILKITKVKNKKSTNLIKVKHAIKYKYILKFVPKVKRFNSFFFLLFIFAFLFFLFYFIFKLYIIVLVLPNTKMNLPQVYMSSPSWTLLPPPSPYQIFNSIWLIKPTFQYLYLVYINNFCCTFQNIERVYAQQRANKVKWYLINKRVELIFWNCWNVLDNSMPRRHFQQWILMLNFKSEFSVNISNIQTKWRVEKR